MALFDKPETPQFDEELRKLETSDKAHATLFNTLFQKLFINTLFLKKKAEKNETAIDTAYQNGNAYTDQKIAELINGAPTTLDTLKELADAIAAGADITEALEQAIGERAKQSELDTHIGNDTIHITASEHDNLRQVPDIKAQVEQNAADIEEQNNNLNGFKFGIDSNGNYGYYKAGADSVTPFKKQSEIDAAYNNGYNAGYNVGKPKSIWEGYIGGYAGAPWSVQVSTSNGNFIIEEISCWVVTGGSLNWSKHEYGKSWSNNVLTINANATEANRNENSFKAYIRVWKFQ